MLRNILVPLDGSTFGEHALPLALDLARRAGGTLHLAHVHQMVPPATVAGVTVMDTIEKALREQETNYLRRTADRLATQGQVPVKSHLLEGDVAEALQRHAQAADIDLVVLSTHGRGPLARFWLGSVADELVRRLDRPVLLVRPEEERADPPRAPVLDHILVPLDGTPLAEEVLETVMPLARLLQARLTLVRVVEPAVRPAYLPEGMAASGLDHSVLEEAREGQLRAEAEAHAYLDRVARPMQDRGMVGVLKPACRVLVEERVAAGILREAEACGASLIALATHGRRGLGRLVLGSVADKVVRGAHVPVLVRRPSADKGAK